jgi:hypothetical protein
MLDLSKTKDKSPNVRWDCAKGKSWNKKFNPRLFKFPLMSYVLLAFICLPKGSIYVMGCLRGA